MIYIDQSLYPDEAPPDAELGPLTDSEKAEHIHRVCAAWEFGLLPEEETFQTLAAWKDIFERFPLSNSIAYHTFRFLLRLPSLPGEILEAPYERLDREEGRSDPCTLFV